MYTSSSFSLLRSLERVLGKCIVHSGDEFNFNCPFCLRRTGRSARKSTLYVNPTVLKNGIKGWYFCHRCKATGPIANIVKDVTSPVAISSWDRFYKNLKHPEIKKEKCIDVTLPRDYVPVSPEMLAYDYLISRGFTPYLIRKFNVGIGTADLREIHVDERQFYAGSGRIIIPDYDDQGRLVYWVARTYKNHKIKYKNPRIPKTDRIFNFYRVKSTSDFIVITEGVISAIMACEQAVATYGKEVTVSQIGMLVSGGFKEYVVALDGDAWGPTFQKSPVYKLSSALTSRGCYVTIVRLPYSEDPASVTNFREYLENRKVFEFKTIIHSLVC